MINAILGVLAGLFVCFMVPVVLIGMLTGDPYLQTLGGIVGIGFFIYVRVFQRREVERKPD